ncbi:MAG TPA: YcaO-like family protein [Actinomycetota bacterium]|nr:YcaO-like family protein [Actinomycetota bacterium]
MSGLCGVVSAIHPAPRDPSEPPFPHAFRALLANHRFAGPDEEPLAGAGKGATPAEARAAALGEAVERYSSSCWGDEGVVRARRADLTGASVDPRDLVLYAPDQYAEVEFAPYDDETVLGWLRARSLVSGEMVHVPALATTMSYRVADPSEYLFCPTSNGLAAGSTLVEAVEGGLLEVLERDAFVIAWTNRLPCVRFDASTHPDPAVRAMAAAYERRGIDLELFRFPTDHPVAVFVALAVERDGEGPAAVAGLGASLAEAEAARKAALEVGQVRPSLRARMRTPEAQRRLAELVADPHRVETLDDHDLLYASRESLPAFDFLFDPERIPFEPEPREPEPAFARVARLVEHFGERGQDVLYYDLTTPDMERLHLRTARVLVPGFQPIDFGWKQQRRGGERLFDLPRQLGLRPRRARPEDLNDDPHPLA